MCATKGLNFNINIWNNYERNALDNVTLNWFSKTQTSGLSVSVKVYMEWNSSV